MFYSLFFSTTEGL